MATPSQVMLRLQRRNRPRAQSPGPPGFDPHPGHTAQPVPDPSKFWQDMINADPFYKQDLVDILAESGVDKGNITAALRSALIQFGGADALKDIVGQLGAQPGWEDLLDSTTLGAAGASDSSGTSLSAQIDKAHAGRNLAIQDVLAAKGILSSEQTGFELGEERQRHTIAESDALRDLLGFLREGIGGFSTREGGRNRSRSTALEKAATRVKDSGMEPPAPPKPPATPPALLQQLIRNSRRPPRRPLRGEAGGW